MGSGFSSIRSNVDMVFAKNGPISYFGLLTALEGVDFCSKRGFMYHLQRKHLVVWLIDTACVEDTFGYTLKMV